MPYSSANTHKIMHALFINRNSGRYIYEEQFTITSTIYSEAEQATASPNLQLVSAILWHILLVIRNEILIRPYDGLLNRSLM